MALLAIDGFDHYGSPSGDMLNRTGYFRWQATSGTTFTTGRDGIGRAISIGVGQLTSIMTSPRTTAWVGFALRASGANTTFYSPPAIRFMDVANGNVVQATVAFNAPSGQVTAYDGQGNILATSPVGAFIGGLFGMMEVGIHIDKTAGWIKVRYAGVLILSVSGVCTQQTSSSTFGGLFFAPINYQGISTSDSTIDDFYLCDDAVGPGSLPCNDFLGDIRVVTLYPTGQGAVAWTPLSSTNVSQVSEIAMDGDTTYNSATTVGATDTMVYGPLPVDVTNVIAVCVTGAYRSISGYSHQITQTLLSSGTSQGGSTTVMATNYGYINDLSVLDPATGASWTKAAASMLQAQYTLTV